MTKKTIEEAELSTLLLHISKLCRLQAGIAGEMPDLTVPQLRSLMIIGKLGPLTITELSAALHADPSVASRGLQALVSQGYISRSEKEDDRRSKYVTIRDKGRELLQQMWSEQESAIKELLSDYPRSDQAQRVLADLYQYMREQSVYATTKK